MGSFRYGEIVRVDFEDRTLAHLQSVIGAKVRRGESFHFSWMDDRSQGGGRSSVWIHPRLLAALQIRRAQCPLPEPGLADGSDERGQLAGRPLCDAGTR